MTDHIKIGGVQLCVRHIIIPKATTTIIFLHDSLGSIALWRDFPKMIAEATFCNVLIYDREGYGQSSPFTTKTRGNDYLEIEADVLYQLIHQFNLKNVVLFGHSDGASIALIFASKYPHAVQAVISEAAHIFVEQQTLNGIQAAVHNYLTTDLKTRLMRYHGDKTDAVFNAWTNTWLQPAFKSWSMEHFLPGIKCPTLIIQGLEDEFGTMAQVTGIAENIKGKAAVFLLPSIGHSPHKEAPEATVARVQQFLQSILAPSGATT